MEHCDAEALAIAALGEPSLHARDARHLRECGACADELEQLTATATLARGSGSDATLPEEVVPPASVWEGVVAELGHSRADPGQAAPPAPVPLRPRATWVRWVGAAAGLALIAAASGVVGALVAGGDRVVVAPTTTLTQTASPTDPGQVVARATLAPLEDGGSSGSARVLDTGAGTVLQVDLADRPSTGGYLEVWLIDPLTFQMVSVGTLPSDAAGSVTTLRVPNGLDLSQYALVDVSDEPLDGVPTHSSVSIARGELVAAT